MENILKAEHISREFPIGDGSVVHALTDINLEVNEGELVCLRGRSGSGKTTLINILGALDRQNSGSVMFCGEDIGKLSDTARDKLRREKLAFVFQSVALISTMTALENVELAVQVCDDHLADEPTAALDSTTGTAVLALFRELVRDDGITVVMTTHDEAMMQLADVVYSLEDGEIVNITRNDIPL